MESRWDSRPTVGEVSRGAGMHLPGDPFQSHGCSVRKRDAISILPDRPEYSIRSVRGIILLHPDVAPPPLIKPRVRVLINYSGLILLWQLTRQSYSSPLKYRL